MYIVYDCVQKQFEVDNYMYSYLQTKCDCNVGIEIKCVKFM